MASKSVQQSRQNSIVNNQKKVINFERTAPNSLALVSGINDYDSVHTDEEPAKQMPIYSKGVRGSVAKNSCHSPKMFVQQSVQLNNNKDSLKNEYEK
jgi:hypothetical protein